MYLYLHQVASFYRKGDNAEIGNLLKLLKRLDRLYGTLKLLQVAALESNDKE